KVRADEARKELSAFSKELTQAKARLEENNQVIQQQKARLDQSIAEFQKQFSAAQDTRGKDFAAEIKKYGDDLAKKGEKFDSEFKTATEARKKEHDVVIKKVTEQSNAHLEFIKQREEEV